MAVRPIDGNTLIEWFRPYLHTGEAIPADVVIENIRSMPTLTPPNEPLTIKQLQKMVGEPVYDYLGQEWYVIQEYYDHELTMTDGTRFFDDDEIDGVDKRFYRRPPEGEEDT